MRYLFILFLFSSSAAAQIPVTDAGNIAQNAITAIKTTQMLINQLKNLRSLKFDVSETLSEDLHQLFYLMGEIEGLMRDLRAIDYQYATIHPDYHTGSGSLTFEEFLQKTDEWIEANDEVIKGAAKTGARVLESLYGSEGEVAALLGRSKSAAGNLQALQAGNQLTGEIAGQLIKANSILTQYTQMELTEGALRNSERKVAQKRLREFLEVGDTPSKREMEINIFKR